MRCTLDQGGGIGYGYLCKGAAADEAHKHNLRTAQWRITEHGRLRAIPWHAAQPSADSDRRQRVQV